MQMLRLDVPATLEILIKIFPAQPDPATERDYHEPQAPHSTNAYAREHEEIFAPLGRLFAQVREISAAITHEEGAFG